MHVTPFRSGTRDVVARFLSKDAKNIPDAHSGLNTVIRLLELTPQVDLKITGKLEAVRDGVLEFRYDLKDHWLRIFVAYWPTGMNVVILHIVLKKANRLDKDDVEIAIRNLKAHKRQTRGGN